MRGKQLQDLTGQKFNLLTVISYSHKQGKKHYWLCKCDCGNEHTVSSSNFKSGQVKSCGCLQGEGFSIGQTYGKLTIIEEIYINNRKNLKCRCKCGNEVVISKLSNLKNGNTKTCGCSRDYKDLTGQRFERLTVLSFSHKDKTNKHYWNCICDCGQPITIRSDSFYGNTKSCGCLHLEVSKSQVGEKSPSYNPNISDEERQIKRNFPENRKWTQDVYERDNYTCQCCGDNKGGNLNAHHIYNYSKYKELRTKLVNGITLCEDCHKEFHKTFGLKKNSNVEQLIAYLIKKKIELLRIELIHQKNWNIVRQRTKC